MSELMHAAAQNWFWSVIGVIAVAGMCTGMVTKIVSRASRERTRREIAAYIAEGSMTPEQGERLLAAGENRHRCD